MLEDTIDREEPQLVRLALPDKPGRLALVASRFAAHEVNILRVEVVAAGDGAAVDDLLVVGGNLALALEELKEDVEILGLREHAELPDPGIAMADALAAVSGSASLGAARHALLIAARRARRCRCAACSCVTRATAGSGPLPPPQSPCHRSGRISRVWRGPSSRTRGRRPPRRRSRGRPPPTALRSAWAASSSSPPACRRFSRWRSSHDAFPFVEAEIERVRALLRVAVGFLGALGERSVRAPLDAPEHVARVRHERQSGGCRPRRAEIRPARAGCRMPTFPGTRIALVDCGSEDSQRISSRRYAS